VLVGVVDELGQLAAGADLPLAAAARAALRRLIDDDSRRVSEAAARTLDRTALRLTETMIDLGRVRLGGSSAARELTVGGGPLAAASAVSTSEKDLRARIEDGSLRVSWAPSHPGRLNATVVVQGPAGEARVQVAGQAVSTRLTWPVPAPPPCPRLPRRPQGPPSPPPSPEATPGRPWPRLAARLRRRLDAVQVAVIAGPGAVRHWALTTIRRHPGSSITAAIGVLVLATSAAALRSYLHQ
jgi:hypothetical protein